MAGIKFCVKWKSSGGNTGWMNEEDKSGGFSSSTNFSYWIFTCCSIIIYLFKHFPSPAGSLVIMHKKCLFFSLSHRMCLYSVYFLAWTQFLALLGFIYSKRNQPKIPWIQRKIFTFNEDVQQTEINKQSESTLWAGFPQVNYSFIHRFFRCCCCCLVLKNHGILHFMWRIVPYVQRQTSCMRAYSSQFWR